jgi:NAD(P)H dehydrogenase (quinone)
MKILVGYYSKTGNTKKMAEAIAKGIKKEGIEVDLRDVNKIKPDDLLNYEALIFGSPTYYGIMAAELKKLLDESVAYHGKLSGKIGGAFTSAGGIGGGAETTILSILEAFLIHGMIVIGESGIFHYGPVSIGSPDEKVLESCAKYGIKIARLMKKICSE